MPRPPPPKQLPSTDSPSHACTTVYILWRYFQRHAGPFLAQVSTAVKHFKALKEVISPDSPTSETSLAHSAKKIAGNKRDKRFNSYKYYLHRQFTYCCCRCTNNNVVFTITTPSPQLSHPPQHQAPLLHHLLCLCIEATVRTKRTRVLLRNTAK